MELKPYAILSDLERGERFRNAIGRLVRQGSWESDSADAAVIAAGFISAPEELPNTINLAATYLVSGESRDFIGPIAPEHSNERK